MALLSRVAAIADDELELMVKMADAGAFASDPPLDPDDILDEEQLQSVQMNVAVLKEHEAFKHLAIWIRSKRARYWLRIAEGLANNDKPVDQREIDFKRGFWTGANWFASVAPGQAAAAFLRRAADDEAREELTD